MPSDSVPLAAIVENLQRVIEQSDKDEPSTSMWRRSTTSLDDNKVHYAEWNLPGMDSDILEKYNVGGSK